MQKHHHASANLISAFLFLLFAFMHGLRIVMEWEASVATFTIPIWFSVVALIVGASMAMWNFREWQCLIKIDKND